MLQTIARDEVVMGMYVHAFTGSWFNHPFWRARFKISDAETLEKIRSSDVAGVVIDLSKGVGMSSPQQSPPSPSPTATAISRLKGKTATVTHLPRVNPTPPRGPEIDKARSLVAHGKRTMMRLFDDARNGRLSCSAEVMNLVEDISASVERSRSTLINIVRLKSKDEYTYLHSVAVCALMVNFARQLNMDEATVRDLGIAGLFHDVGKMAVPLEILNKAGRLTDNEFLEIKAHTTAGRDLLEQCDTVPAVALDVAAHHHERVDGTGYPFGLSGAALSVPARMGAICDIYDALTSDRSYKEAWSPADAIAQMDSWTGHLDQDLLFAFMRSINIYPPAMLVRLRSNRLGIVIPNGRRGSRARVRVFLSALDRTFLPMQDVVLGDGLAHDQVISRENPAHWALDHWPSMQADLLARRFQPPVECDTRVA